MINLFELIMNDVGDSIEWLQTIEGDEVKCISVENLEAILKKYV